MIDFFLSFPTSSVCLFFFPPGVWGSQGSKSSEHTAVPMRRSDVIVSTDRWCNTVSCDIALVNIRNYSTVHEIFRLGRRLRMCGADAGCFHSSCPHHLTSGRERVSGVFQDNSTPFYSRGHIPVLSCPPAPPIAITGIKYEAWRKRSSKRNTERFSGSGGNKAKTITLS